MIAASSNASPDKPAVVEYGPEGRTTVWTYSQLYGAACAFAGRLSGDLGLEPGGRMVLSGPNSGHWVAACLGIHLAGMTVVPMDTEYGDADRANILSFADQLAVVCTAGLREKFSSCPLLIELESVVPVDSGCEINPIPLASGQPFSIVFTSGSTATPKGVMLTEDNFLHNVNVLRSWGRLISRSDILLDLLPLHHVYAFTATLLLTLCVGCTVVYPASLKPADISAAAVGEQATIMAVVPQVLSSIHNRVIQESKSGSLFRQVAYKLMAAVGSLGIERGWRPGRLLFGALHRRFGALRFFACGGAKLDPHVHRALSVLGFRIVEAYGLSETAPVVTFNDPGRPVFGSVGKAAPQVELRLAESTGGIEDREVLVRGPNVMAGYWKLPEETAKAFDDGWFRTGDLGRMDERGNLYITGRSKEVIVMPSGKNVYPDELEKIYEQSELIEEICLCLTEHGGREHLTAVVVPSRDSIRRRKISDISGEVRFELENIGVRLPSYQRVTRIVLTGYPLPRTRLGKLRRYQVLQRLESESSGETASGPPAAGDSGDPLLSFAARELKLNQVPTGRESLELDLGLDSLSKLDFISAAEREFGFTLGDEEAASLVALDDFRSFIGREEADNLAGAARSVALEELVDLRHSRAWNIIRWWARLKLRFFLALFYRAKVTGLENLPDSGPCLLAPNHASYLDGLIVHAMVPGKLSRRMFSIATAEIFDRWPFHQISYRARIIKTGTLETAARSLQHAMRLLELGHPLCLFPEGKRSIDGRVDEPKPGLGLLAEKTGAPVVPIYIHGNNALLSRSHPGLHLSRITVDILPPITLSAGKDKLLADWLSAMRRAEERHAGS